MSTNFDAIDRMAIQTICETYDECSILMSQYLNSTILRREVSPVGWYTYFQVNDSCERLSKTKVPIGNAVANVENMEVGIGFMLWIKDGMLCCLEAFTYGDEYLPEAIEIISLTNT